jgi:hypothetical protein
VATRQARMSVIFSVLGAESLLTDVCALAWPSVALNKGPSMAVAAALLIADRRVRAARGDELGLESSERNIALNLLRADKDIRG